MPIASASILITGSEILDGRVPDTNSHLIIEQLTEAGLVVNHTLSCTDDLKTLKRSLDFLFTQSTLVVISGGMGPTSDDLTRELASLWSEEPLEEREEALAHLRSFYAARGRVFDDSNRKQALFPKGALMIANPHGTAPGFFLQCQRDGQTLSLIALPGVPGELRHMLQDSVVPLVWQKVLNRSGPPQLPARRCLRIFWLPESQVGARIAASNVDKDLLVSYRAAFPEVHVILKAPFLEFDLSRLEASYQRARTAVGEDLILTDDLSQSLDSLLHGILRKRNLRFAAAESCTGGMLGELMTTMPGSSDTFLGSAVTYSNQAKQSLLGVSAATLRQHGAVSFAAASEMALGALNKFGSDCAVSITGIAGPDGGSADKPVGTFFVGYANKQGVVAYKCFFSSNRSRIRRFAAFTALDVARRHLLDMQVSWPSEKL